MQDTLPPKRQAVVDRLRRRIENYRRHQSDCEPRFDRSFTGIVENNFQETQLLKQKYLESKAKRSKKPEKKLPPPHPTLDPSLHTGGPLPKYGTKRHASEDPDGADGGFNEPPPSKTVPPAPPPSSQAEGPRFSVEIVQQLEFVGSTSNCCTINTNVTVNTSIKSDSTTCSSSSSRKSAPPDTGQGPGGGGGGLVCKQEEPPDNPEFVDLETCAAALEQDGASLAGLGEFLGDSTHGINADAFKDLISEITDFHPEFMKDFNFDEKPPLKHQHVTNNNSLHSNHNHSSPQLQQHFIKEEQLEPSQNCKPGSVPQQQYPAFPKSELSPAAQTLKHMAQQHQHKTQQMGMNFNPIKQEVFNSNTFNGTNNSGVGAGSLPSPLPNKPSPGGGCPPRPSMNPTPPGGGFKQSPYSPASPSPSYHHKAGASPRPPSCPSSQQTSNPGSLIVNQAQSMHISPAQAQNIQVSMAQNVSTDMKPNLISVAAQQGMYYSSSTPPTPASVSDPGFCSSQSQSVNFSQPGGGGGGGLRHRTPAPQHQPPVRHPGLDPKLLQQQQQHSMMRSQLLQQQQQQQQQSATSQQVVTPRPPPPEYKMNPLQNMMPPHLQNVLMQQRFASSVPPHQRARPMQQPMPPSGPMMRPHSGGGNIMQGAQLSALQQQQRLYLRSQRPPNITPTEALTPSAEWRHMMAQANYRPQGNSAGPPSNNFQQMQSVMYNSGGSPGMQLSSLQMQQLPTSRNNMSSMHHQNMNMQHSSSQMNLNLQMSQQASMNSMNGFPGRNPSQQSSNPQNTASNQQQPHPNSLQASQQQNAMGNPSNPMGNQQSSMGNQQNQMVNQANSMSNQQNSMGNPQNPMGNQMSQQQMNHMSNFAYQQQQQQQHSSSNGFQQHSMQQTYMSHQSSSSGLNGLPSDFNLDFLDGHVSSADSSFNDQDILRSLESGASFNLQDIL